MKGGKYGSNQWKIRLFNIGCVLLILFVIYGACVFIVSKYNVHQEAKKEAEREHQEELKKEEEQAEAEEGSAEEEGRQDEMEKEEKSDQKTKKSQETSKKTEDALSGDYVIADSNSRYLTSNELQKFSLKEINYAKNEIYARWGRKFQSKELQDYFNSKSWYKGTIEPDAFRWDIFNNYEKANAELLSKIEFERDPKGYLLDQ